MEGGPAAVAVVEAAKTRGKKGKEGVIAEETKRVSSGKAPKAIPVRQNPSDSIAIAFTLKGCLTFPLGSFWLV